MCKSSSESGNVLFLILIAVALFAALSFAVIGSSRTTPSDSFQEVDNLAISQTLNYVSSINLGMTRLKARGLATNEIDLCDAAFTTCDDGIDGGNPVCRTGENCLFSAEGGGVIFQELPEELLVFDAIGGFRFSEAATASDPILAFTVQNGIPSNGVVEQRVCLDINENLGISFDTTDARTVPEGYEFSCVCIGVAVTSCPQADGTGAAGNLNFSFVP